MSTSTLWISASVIFLAALNAVAVSSQPLNEDELAERLRFYREISSLEVGFTQVKTIKDLKVQIPSEGRLTLKGREEVIWQVDKPSLVRLTFDRKTIKVESGAGADYTVQTLKVDELPSDKEARNIASLEAWLQLDARALSKQYLVTSQGTKQLEFTPKDTKNSTFRSVRLDLAPSGHLERLHIAETSGDEIDIRFKKPVVRYTKGNK